MAQEGLPVKIRLTTAICHGESTETFELIVFGRYYQKNESNYLIYNEVLENGIVNTMVKWGEEEALIYRKGILNMKLSFHLRGRKSGSYETELGAFLLETVTDSLAFQWNEEEKSGYFDLKYKLFLEHTNVGTYHLSFDFKEDLKA